VLRAAARVRVRVQDSYTDARRASGARERAQRQTGREVIRRAMAGKRRRSAQQSQRGALYERVAMAVRERQQPGVRTVRDAFAFNRFQ